MTCIWFGAVEFVCAKMKWRFDRAGGCAFILFFACILVVASMSMNFIISPCWGLEHTVNSSVATCDFERL